MRRGSRVAWRAIGSGTWRTAGSAGFGATRPPDTMNSAISISICLCDFDMCSPQLLDAHAELRIDLAAQRQVALEELARERQQRTGRRLRRALHSRIAGTKARARHLEA